MARQRRINIPGAIYHVIARGLNGMNIFRDNSDRKTFINKLAEVVNESKSRCYAWTLMSNHIHLLIRSSEQPLSEVMRRVLSYYAIHFNKKHKRKGYLFQNRFKSILCQENSYFLALIRYIHLNPVRAGLVESMKDLNNYKYCGHATIIGKYKNEFQEISEVLSWFGSKRRYAIDKYQDFMLDGWSEGKREDLTGGGLRRSAGGWHGIFELKKQKERWQGDDRILGDGEFVKEVLKQADEKMKKAEKRRREGWTLEKLAIYICRMMKVNLEDLNKKGKSNDLSYAKGMIAYWGCKELGLKGSEIARYLGISNPGVSYLVKIGEFITKEKSWIF